MAEYMANEKWQGHTESCELARLIRKSSKRADIMNISTRDTDEGLEIKISSQRHRGLALKILSKNGALTFNRDLPLAETAYIIIK